jgi:uncharacterized membrane protein
MSPAFEITKFIHVVCAVIFVGINVASFFYISFSAKHYHPKVFNYALRANFFGDILSLILILILFGTAGYLVPAAGFSLATPWIRVAYSALGLVTIIWIIDVILKYKSYKANKLSCPRFYTSINILMFIIFIVIIHDAVMHRTWFA